MAEERYVFRCNEVSLEEEKEDGTRIWRIVFQARDTRIAPTSFEFKVEGNEPSLGIYELAPTI